jgi:hypothetical protein
MKNILRNPYVSILIFSTPIILIHWGIDSFFSIVTYYSFISIYAFHIISAFFVAGTIQWIYANYKDYAGFAFMGTSLFKMLAAISFLLPGFLSDDKPSFANILNFFVPYFIYLVFEAIKVIKLINPKESN